MNKKIKVAIYFTNDGGEYYVENAALFNGEQSPKTEYKHAPVMVIDETAPGRSFEAYRAARMELNNPTTKDGDVIVLIQHVEDCR